MVILMEANIAGVTFNSTSNISLVNFTFQHSQITAVTFLDISENINVIYCNFLSNKRVHLRVASHCGGLSIHHSGANLIYVVISDSYFYDNGFCNGYYGDLGRVLDVLQVDDPDNITMWNIIITKTIFSSNMGPVNFFIGGEHCSSSIQLIGVSFINNNALNVSDNVGILPIGITNLGFMLYGNSCSVLVLNSLFSDNIGDLLLWVIDDSNKAEIMIFNSTFTNNQQGSISLVTSAFSVPITLIDVEISHNLIDSSKTLVDDSDAGILSIEFDDYYMTDYYDVTINLTRVNMLSNKYLGSIGGAIYIDYDNAHTQNGIKLEECIFFNNTASRGTAIYIDNGDNNIFHIINSKIYNNIADDSVIYLNNMNVTVISSSFMENVGSSMYLFLSNLKCDRVIFVNNRADNGAALYLYQGYLDPDDLVTVQFINNLATEKGGAIFINIVYDCFNIPFAYSNSEVSFVNNTARISGNSLYFYIPKLCKVETNISDQNSIMYAPCHFNYSQPVNGKMLHIPCDLDYTLLNGTGAPIVTSPHELRLYFPFNDGYNISSTSDHNIYFIGNNVLGYPVKFTGNVFDYFGKPAEPTQFDVFCVKNCLSTVLPNIYILADNITSLSITFSGENIRIKVNVTVMLTSTIRAIKEINTTLVVELIPCIDHPGYTYSTAHKACVCYHHNVDCHDSYNEIKRGYWFGSVMDETSTSICPKHYCKFTSRTETRQGYYKLPSTIDDQCTDHRVGRACGECSSRYTLSYDSTDCISVDQCGTGWTVLVITLTCLYWIVIVAGVFGLMYFKFQISLGHLYGLIYYYSIMNILLDSNPNLSDGVFQFASVLSSFAQLTPQFLGELCFVKGLSGIDQLFIHYSHAVGVSLLLLLIVVAARWSARVTLFVSRCIIRVICLLILLSYTSIVSTSLQLLQPLRFTDVKEWYTYSSPNIQYFHGRHAVYGVVAIICELVVGIGLPLLLLLQPFLSRKINFIRIKPLLDQFQGCYKDKYRWFAAYYLICRQVIFLIAYSFNVNNNSYDTAFYLLTTCVVITSVHIWIQPYQSNLLNALDGIMLLLMIQVNGFAYVNGPLTISLELITILLPVILVCSVFITKGIHSCRKKEHRYHNINISNADIDDGVTAEENIIRFVSLTIT